MSKKEKKKPKAKPMTLHDFHASVDTAGPTFPPSPSLQGQTSRKQHETRDRTSEQSTNWRKDGQSVKQKDTWPIQKSKNDRTKDNDHIANTESIPKSSEISESDKAQSLTDQGNRSNKPQPSNNTVTTEGKYVSPGQRASANHDSWGPKSSGRHTNYSGTSRRNERISRFEDTTSSKTAMPINAKSSYKNETYFNDDNVKSDDVRTGTTNSHASATLNSQHTAKSYEGSQSSISGKSTEERYTSNINKRSENQWRNSDAPDNKDNNKVHRSSSGGQRSRSNSSHRNVSRDREDRMVTNQRTGVYAPKHSSHQDNKSDVFDKFTKWQDSNFPVLENIICKIIDENGDLFSAAPEYSLAHCVAEDFGMGSGIAVQFRQMFKRVDDLLDQRSRQGGVAYLEENGRYIYYMVTKKKSNGKPTYASFCKSLETLRQKMEEHDVKKLAIPRIGCGLDRLEWSIISNMIKFIFQKTDVEIIAYNYVQQDERSSQPAKGSSRTVKIVNRVMDLVSIESQTGLVFFASEDHDITPEMEDLDKKYNFLSEYKHDRKKLGDVFEIEKKKEYIYGLYVKKTERDEMSYKALGTCLNKLQKDKDLQFIGIQAFEDSNDPLIMAKIQTMCKNFLFFPNKEVYICWPNKLRNLMPYN